MSSIRNKKEEVFVIKSTNYSEADKIITVFGKTRGKFALFAKGVRKLNSKNRGNIQTFSISKISYYESTGMPLLLETEQMEIVDYLEVSPKQAQRVLFVLNKILPEESPNEYIFDALKSLVKRKVSLEYVNKFLLVFLIQEGLVGDLSECNTCNLKKEKLFLDKYAFTSICNDCIENGNLEKERFIQTNKSLYLKSEFSESLDRYILKIIQEIA